MNGDETFVVEQDDLAAENVTYYREDSAQTYDVERIVDNPILNDPIGTGQWSLRDRTNQTIYSSPHDIPTAPSYRLEVEDENEDWIIRSAEDFKPAGGVETPVAVNKHPFTGTASVDVGEYVEEDNVQLTVNPQVSQGPVRGILETRDDSTDYTVTRDGSVVDQGQVDGPTVSYTADDSLSDGTTYEIVTQAENGDRSLSTSTRTAVRTTYTEGGDNTPPTVAEITPPELSTENSLPTGPVDIDLTVEDDNPEDLTVLVRYADGTVTSDPYDGSITDTSDDWHDASVTAVDTDAGEYRATIDTDLGTDTVHLEVAVLDDGGNAISTAAYDAYAVDDRETGGVIVSDASLTDETIQTGETAEATATLENLDPEATEFEAEFRLTDDDGSVLTVASETVHLDAEESTTVTLSGTVDSAGTYSADVSGEPAGQLAVEGPAVFELSDGTLNRTEIEPGETVEASATLENVGDEEGTVTADLEVNGTVEASTDVTLSAGESTTVAFKYEPETEGEYGLEIVAEDNDGGETTADAGTLTVSEPDPAEFVVSNAQTSDVTIEEGETVTVTADVENVGDESGSFTAEFQVDDSVEETTAVELDPGEETTVSFDRTFDEAGTYYLAVSDESAGEVTVTEPGEPAFETRDLAVEENPILEGDSVDITATVENVGDDTGEHTAELIVNNSVVASDTVQLDPDQSTTVSFTRTFDTAGEYAVMIDDAGPITLAVEEPAAFETTDASLSESEIEAGDSVQITGTVENVGDREGTHEATLFRDGDAVETTAVTVAGGETETVTFDRTYENTGTYELKIDDAHAGDLTVTEPGSPAFELSNGTVTPEELLDGESVTVEITVENVGDDVGEHTAELLVNDTVVATETEQLDAGDSANLTFVHTFDTAGNYEVAVDDTHVGSVDVLAPADVEIVNATLGDEEIDAGDSVGVNVTVENLGDVEGTRSLALLAGNETLATQNVTVTPDSQKNVNITHTFENPGDYQLHVEDHFAGNLTVREADESTDGGDSGDGESGGDGGGSGGGGPPPGFGSSPDDGDEQPDPEPEVSIDSSPGGALVSVTDPGQELLELELNEPGDGSFVHNSLQITPGEEADDFQLDVSPPASSPREAPEPTEHRAIGYVEVERIDIENEDIEKAEFVITLRGHQLPADTTKENVTMLRYHDGEWEELETEHLRGDRYAAVTPGFSEFAVAVEGAPEPAFEIVDAGVDDRTVLTGDAVTVRATIANVGDAEGAYETQLLVEDDVVSTAEVSIEPGTSETVDLSATFESPGTYEVTLTKWEEPIEVVVEPDNDAAPSDEEQITEEPAVDDPRDAEDDDGPLPFPDVPRSVWTSGLIGMILVALLVNLLAIGPEVFSAPKHGETNSRTDGGTSPERASQESTSSESTSREGTGKEETLPNTEDTSEIGEEAEFDWVQNY
ncbi:cell surface glycoprotein [Halalkaliarchaeum desulfuricum]|uniref:Cell surface glycoprotein n=1 Tax=Halalkaliarchaeum desulfuricum TaxID=2055893 RepID=A0A343TMQ6_9EURY|nr:CARDB domain-containing protein [Halalkaliarchaeum desulfuricum]AUX10378.1 cell surface glycoprotein [Halalkaliarchaeum desulfuricum]